MAARPSIDDCEALFERLAHDFALREVAAHACAEEGVPEHSEQVAYCVAAVARKRQPDLDDARFPEEIAGWARTIAANMRRWGDDYTAVQDGAEIGDTMPLERLIRVRTGDDVTAAVALDLAIIVDGGARLGEMRLEELCDDPPASNAYLFEGSLSAWATRSTKHRAPRDTRPLADLRKPPAVAGVVQELEQAETEGSEVVRLLVEAVAKLAATRKLLAEVIAPIRRLEQVAQEVAATSRVPAAELDRLRAFLLDVADELDRERRALSGMLAYVVLALRNAEQMQHVAMLSLRLGEIDSDAVEEMAARMRAVLEDEAHPTSLFVAKVANAKAAVGPKRRTDLEDLRKRPERRAANLAPVARRLDELPPVVADDRAISAVVETTLRTVTVQKSAAAGELTAVDEVYGRAFRRYTMGMP